MLVRCPPGEDGGRLADGGTQVTACNTLLCGATGGRCFGAGMTGGTAWVYATASARDTLPASPDAVAVAARG